MVLSFTPALHMAATRGRREFCEMLVKRGADITIADDSGRLAGDMTDDAELAAQLRYALHALLRAVEVAPTSRISCGPVY